MHDLEFNDEDFGYFRRLLLAQAGITLADHKRQLVYGRLARRVRELGLGSFSAYRDWLKQAGGEELGRVVNALTTNVTAFMREPHHFEFLRSMALPQLERQHELPLRIWSAGCSSGEEAYSIAMTVAEWRSVHAARILATDIDTDVVERARAGEYPAKLVEVLGAARQKRWLLRGTGASSGRVRVKQLLRDMCVFEQLNLLDAWPMQRQFHVIFCRNVMIYFNEEVRRQLVARFAAQLVPGGYLFIGHSESLHGLSDAFEGCGQTVYRRLP